MRELVLKHLDSIWEEGFELEFNTTQIDAHLLPDVELFSLFKDILTKNLQTQNSNYKEELRKLYGVDRPFICGDAGERGADGLKEYILVCPMYGADGFAMYKKHKDYSAPGY